MNSARGSRGAVALLVVLVMVALAALVPSQVASQSPTEEAPYLVFLPVLQQAFNPGAVDVPPANSGIGTAYQRYAPDEVVAGQALVKWREDVDIDTITRINSQFSVQVVGTVEGLAVQVLQAGAMPAEHLVATYGALPEVEYAEPNFIAWASPVEAVGAPLAAVDLKPDALTTNDPQAAQQYSLWRMSVNSAWDVTRGDGVVIGVLDTGVDGTHPDLQGKLVSMGRDFVNNDYNATDDHGHGTHVSGIAAAATNNGVGVAGIGYNARVLPVKVLSSSGSGSYSAIASGITWAADNGARIINLSLGGPGSSTTLDQAIAYAWNKGVVIVAAAGNENTSSPTYPASSANVIGVCATDQADAKASFSNYGINVDVCAPGVNIWSTVRGGSYQAWDGTSMASPNAAGVAALVAAAHPTWTNSQIKQALENTTDNIGSSTYFGRGRLNAARAVGAATPGQPTSTPPPAQPTATRTLVPAATATTAPVNDYVNQLYSLINQQRALNGNLPALRPDSRLADAADFHNRWMRDNNCFAHQCTNEPDPWARIRNAGYPMQGGSETIGAGYRTPQDMVNGWMNSSGHRAILLGSLPDIGCGYLAAPSSTYGTYWTCDFASGGGTAPAPTRTPVPATSTPSAPTATPPRTPTPTPTGTVAAPSPTPTRTTTGPSPTPTRTATPGSPPGGQTIVLTPPSNLVGWLNSGGQTGWSDDDLYSGWYYNRAYIAAVQFPLDALPANANITAAQLELTGQTTEYIAAGTAPTWTVRWLASSIDGQFPSVTYATLAGAAVRSTLSPTLGRGDVAANRKNTFALNAAQIADLKSQKSSTNKVTFRIDGATTGSSDSAMSWDSGWGIGGLGAAARPVLRITLGP